MTTGEDRADLAYGEHRRNSDVDSLIQAAEARRAAPLLTTITQSSPPPTSTSPPSTDAAATMPTGSEADPGASALRTFGRNVREIPLQSLFGAWDAVLEAVDIVKYADPFVAAAAMQGKNVPEVSETARGREPQTATGELVRTGAKFVAGFVPANRVVKGASVALSSMRGLERLAPVFSKIGKSDVLRSFVAGALTDATVFDGDDPRFSNFVQDLGISTPMTDWLAAAPGDSEALGRFKNALEGAGLGIASEGLVAVARMAKAARLAKEPVKLTGKDAARKALAATEDILDPAVPADAFNALGSSDGPLVSTRPDRMAAATRRAQGGQVGDLLADTPDLAGPREMGMEQPGVYVNLARINEPDDVRRAISRLAQRDTEAINAARGGEKQSFAEMEALADQLDMSVDDVVNRRRGPMGAAEAVAARKLLSSSGEQVVALARKAAGAGASEADKLVFQRALAVHYSIQQEVIAARTETARALASWRIPAAGDAIRLSAVSDALTNLGGGRSSSELARMVATLADDPKALNQFVRQGFATRFSKGLKELWINGLLSSPKTHAVNVLSNTLTAAWSVPERAMAAGIDNAFGRGEIVPGEVMASLYGATKGARDGLTLAGRALKTGEGSDLFTKVEQNIGSAISSEAIGVNADSAIGHAIDYIGTAVNAPGRLLMAEDEFFKSIGYRMELHSQAYRQAMTEGLTGADLAARIDELVRAPSDAIKLAATDFAHYQTFTAPLGKMGRNVTTALNSVPGARYIVPFVRTPANILKYSFERTPLAVLSANVRADISAGGARASMALAKVGTGTMVMLAAADMVANGELVGAGPMEPGLRKLREDQGVPQYSVRIGDRWFQFSRLDPLGFHLGMAADIAEIAALADQEDAENLITAGTLAMINNTASKTWLSGAVDFVEVLSRADESPAFAERFMQRFGSSFQPFSSLLRNAEQAMDPVVRDAAGNPNLTPGMKFVDGLINRVRAQTPGLSADLPPMRNVWGDEIRYDSGIHPLYDFLSPVGGRKDDPDPVDQIMLENRIPLSMPGRSLQGVKLSAAEYSRYVELAGRGDASIGIVGAKPLLDDMVEQPSFQQLSDGPDGMKAELIDRVIRASRKQAQAALLRENEDLQRRVLRYGERKRQVLTEGGLLQ